MAAFLPDEVAELASYFERTYFGATIGGRRRTPLFTISEWSQHGRTLQGLARTNNGVEGWHNRFGNVVDCAHPNVYKLLKHLGDEETHWRSEVAKILLRATERNRRAQGYLTIAVPAGRSSVTAC